MLSTLLGICLTGIFLVTRCFGQVVRIRGLSFFAAYGLSYASKTCTISIDKLYVKFHLPRPQAPYWAIITGEKYNYEDGSCHVSFGTVNFKLWFFPTHFRFTAGPWIESTIDGFAVNVRTSQHAPWWIDTLRTHIVTTIMNGDTILLHTINTKLYFGTIEKPHEEPNSEIVRYGLREGETDDDLRVRVLIEQWNIITSIGRMYSLGKLTAELRRSWIEDTGTFVVIANECRWTKLRNTEPVKDQSLLWSFLNTICSLPTNIVKTYMDPTSVMSLVDVYARRLDISFSEFHLRDAQLFHEGSIKMRQKYDQFSHKNPGVLENIAWDLFVGGVVSSFQD